MRWRARGLLLGVALVLLAVAPVGVAVWLLVEANQEEAAVEQQASADARRTDAASENTCVELLAEAHQECVEQAHEIAQQHYDNLGNLEAQRVTAIWTRFMGIAALFGTAFGLIGMTLVLATFWANKRAADAARDANLIASDTMRRQLRAYVVVTEVYPVEFKADEISQFSADLVNCGQTPAQRLRIFSSCFFYRLGDRPPPIRFERPKEGADHSEMTLAPDKPFTFLDPMTRSLCEEEIELLARGEYGCIWAGIVVYRDIFNKRHMTTFKCEWDRNAPHGPGNFRICKRGNYAG